MGVFWALSGGRRVRSGRGSRKYFNCVCTSVSAFPRECLLLLLFLPFWFVFPFFGIFFFAFLRINAGSKSMTTTTLRAILDVQQMACENIYIFFCCVLSLRLVRLKDGMMLRLRLRAKKKGNREYD